jgi:hypothetical protein
LAVQSTFGEPFPDTTGGGAPIPVSTAFYPGAPVHITQADIILLSSDYVLFYVHSGVLDRSQNRFNSLLQTVYANMWAGQQRHPLPYVSVPETSLVLNILLHAVYDLPCIQYSPAIEHTFNAATALSKYGFDMKNLLATGTSLYNLLATVHAPAAPMVVYSFAGAHGLTQLAVAASAHLHNFPLPALDDALAERMGARYLRRLFFLHLGRIDALKRLLIAPPEEHPPNPVCNAGETKKMTRAWALGSAYVGWDARAGEFRTGLPRMLMQAGG